MFVFCWMAHIKSDVLPHSNWNELKTDLLVVAPDVNDSKVHAPRPADYEARQGIDEDGCEWVHIEIRFKSEAEATAFYDSAKGLIGDFEACKEGDPGSSYMHVHECEIPKKGCRIIKEIKST